MYVFICLSGACLHLILIARSLSLCYVWCGHQIKQGFLKMSAAHLMTSSWYFSVQISGECKHFSSAFFPVRLPAVGIFHPCGVNM